MSTEKQADILSYIASHAPHIADMANYAGQAIAHTPVVNAMVHGASEFASHAAAHPLNTALEIGGAHVGLNAGIMAAHAAAKKVPESILSKMPFTTERGLNAAAGLTNAARETSQEAIGLAIGRDNLDSYLMGNLAGRRLKSTDDIKKFKDFSNSSFAKTMAEHSPHFKNIFEAGSKLDHELPNVNNTVTNGDRLGKKAIQLGYTGIGLANPHLGAIFAVNKGREHLANSKIGTTVLLRDLYEGFHSGKDMGKGEKLITSLALSPAAAEIRSLGVGLRRAVDAHVVDSEHKQKIMERISSDIMSRKVKLSPAGVAEYAGSLVTDPDILGSIQQQASDFGDGVGNTITGAIPKVQDKVTNITDKVSAVNNVVDKVQQVQRNFNNFKDRITSLPYQAAAGVAGLGLLAGGVGYASRLRKPAIPVEPVVEAVTDIPVTAGAIDFEKYKKPALVVGGLGSAALLGNALLSDNNSEKAANTFDSIIGAIGSGIRSVATNGIGGSNLRNTANNYLSNRPINEVIGDLSNTGEILGSAANTVREQVNPEVVRNVVNNYASNTSINGLISDAQGIKNSDIVNNVINRFTGGEQKINPLTAAAAGSAVLGSGLLAHHLLKRRQVPNVIAPVVETVAPEAANLLHHMPTKNVALIAGGLGGAALLGGALAHHHSKEKNAASTRVMRKMVEAYQKAPGNYPKLTKKLNDVLLNGKKVSQVQLAEKILGGTFNVPTKYDTSSAFQAHTGLNNLFGTKEPLSGYQSQLRAFLRESKHELRSNPDTGTVSGKVSIYNAHDADHPENFHISGPATKHIAKDTLPTDRKPDIKRESSEYYDDHKPYNKKQLDNTVGYERVVKPEYLDSRHVGYIMQKPEIKDLTSVARIEDRKKQFELSNKDHMRNNRESLWDARSAYAGNQQLMHSKHYTKVKNLHYANNNKPTSAYGIAMSEYNTPDTIKVENPQGLLSHLSNYSFINNPENMKADELLFKGSKSKKEYEEGTNIWTSHYPSVASAYAGFKPKGDVYITSKDPSIKERVKNLLTYHEPSTTD